MREIRLSGLEGGVAVTRHPYPYIIAPDLPNGFRKLQRSGIASHADVQAAPMEFPERTRLVPINSLSSHALKINSVP